MPTISVIVPVYKVEPYLHRCVDSILRQTYKDFDLILVDDGSPDNCGVICDEYAQKDSRVVVIHQENGGLSAARNAGIDWAFVNSNSQWLTFVDSDDWVHPEYLQRLWHAVSMHNVAISVCGYRETEGDISDVQQEMLEPILWNAEKFYAEHYVNATVAWGKLYHKSCFECIRYPVGKIHEDEFVTYRILFQYEKLAAIPVPLYAYFVNHDGITKGKWSPQRLDAVEAFKQQATFFRESGQESVRKRSIWLYATSLLWQYEQYVQVAQRSKAVDREFKCLARYFLLHCWNEIELDTERRLHLLWIAFPGVAKMYHAIKK